MTQSFDELFAPKAMTLDELFAAIRPPPLLPLSYPPSDNSDFMPASPASAQIMPQPISPDRLWAGMKSGPFNGINDSSGLGYPKVSNAGQASIPNDDLLFHILARQSAGPDYSASAQTLSPNPLLDGGRAAPLDAVNHSSGLGYPDTDGRASAIGPSPISKNDLLLHTLARQSDGLRPLSAYSAARQTLPPDRLLAGVQPPPLTPLNYADPPNYAPGLAEPPLPLAAYTRSGAPNTPRLQNIVARSGPAASVPATASMNPVGNGVPLKLPDGSSIPDPTSSTGYLMSPTKDLSSVARAGRLTGENYNWLLQNPNGASGAFNYLVGSLGSHLGHGGSLDYQREGNFLTGYTHRPQFVHISNFNVGLFAQQVGLTLEEAHRFAGGYASLFSNNADPGKPYGLNKDQYDFIEAGYKAGASGLYGPAAPSRLQP